MKILQSFSCGSIVLGATSVKLIHLHNGTFHVKVRSGTGGYDLFHSDKKTALELFYKHCQTNLETQGFLRFGPNSKPLNATLGY